MIELAIASVVIASLTGILVNKWLDFIKEEAEHHRKISNEQNLTAKELISLQADVRASIDTIKQMKQELETVKLSQNLRGR